MSSDKDNRGDGNPVETPSDLVFRQYALPPLESGRFTVTVKQEVAVQGEECDTFQASQDIIVAGERYALGPSDVDSVFPPAGNQGEFSNNLAHVVLTSPTLPWQRSPNPSQDKPVAGQPVATWLGVLLFDQNDPPPAPHHVTVADLVTTKSAFFPPRVPEEGDSLTDPVTVLDIPITLFNAIAPSLADLNWTAHVRTVDPVAKALGGGVPPSVDYSVVFGNRLPVPGNKATAHLVSLESFGPYLPASDGTPSPAIPGGTDTVRIVTLQSWNFTAVALKQTFSELLKNVNLTPSALQYPYDNANASGDSVADTAVRNAFGLGYTAMNHKLRDGGSTVSWYRGPLVPLALPTPPAGIPWADADMLLRYDPTQGMFDLSYSAAWQLGRLLALHDSAFATALYRWKLAETQAKVAAMEQEIIDQELPGITPSDSMASRAGAVGASPPALSHPMGEGARRAGEGTPIGRFMARTRVQISENVPTPETLAFGEGNARHARMSAVIKQWVGPALAQLRAATKGK